MLWLEALPKRRKRASMNTQRRVQGHQPSKEGWRHLGWGRSAAPTATTRINFLDAMPAPNGKSFHLQIRELTDEDLRRRETNRENHGGGGGDSTAGGFSAPSSRVATASISSGDDIPF